ncbi:hypothetical protein GM418_16365 [Maribellus comscasis]|uniref:Uncharacterized protein n=1 Tax=Maribellus comscasis TaxID=2681766 RepID=A0A6I6JV82_9BACT|nr:hypothetical protein [Maribellus comscasis]QGY45189.1 hypothetical protein GM418_16365 [Maribellus comscasis]
MLKKISPLLFILIASLFTKCSIFEEEDTLNLSQIDFLHGTKESGRLKKQLNYSDSDDKTLNSDIEYFYEDNHLITKVYHEYLGGEPYILQKDELIYDGEKLSQMVHYFRTGTTTSPLLVSKTYYYSYPDANTKIEVVYNAEGERRDSVIYRYSGNLLTEEKHVNHLGIWGNKYEYNNEGKLYKTIDLADEHMVSKNHFDRKGLLVKTERIVDGNIESTIWYESEITRTSLFVTMYPGSDSDSDIRLPGAQKKFRDGKLVEYILYHPTFPGSEWYCQRFEYY